jgi:DNA-directed RNA polymerase-3 subunit RPC5
MAEDNVEDSDPVLKSYDIYIKPGMNQEREIYVFQFPNRSHKLPYLHRLKSQPQKLRTKPNSGMVEIDVPVDTWNFYDRLKGVQWGEALKESNATKGKGSHGLPGGFGIGGTQSRGKGRGKTEEEENLNHMNTLSDFGGAIDRNQILKKQTLGGQVVTKNESNPTYMIGTFRKSRITISGSENKKLIIPRSTTFHTCRSYSSNATSIPPYRCDVRAQENERCSRSSCHNFGRSSYSHGCQIRD